MLHGVFVCLSVCVLYSDGICDVFSTCILDSHEIESWLPPWKSVVWYGMVGSSLIESIDRNSTLNSIDTCDLIHISLNIQFKVLKHPLNEMAFKCRFNPTRSSAYETIIHIGTGEASTIYEIKLMN